MHHPAGRINELRMPSSRYSYITALFALELVGGVRPARTSSREHRGCLVLFVCFSFLQKKKQKKNKK
eukprot:SAG11_NODE_560_length_8528_cov_4.697710_13_plen_67_part_00